MSLRDRLFNVAKAELKDAAKRLRTSAEHIIDGHERPFAQSRRRRPAEEELDEEIRARSRASRGEDAQIRRYYANLELPLGASREEVRAAYRRLMRRYHPDKHAADPARAKVAHELSQQLRTAYDGLMAHLDRQP